ncbi:MAG: hypothetical protein WCQ54_12950 [Clostridiaceae bacterium]
MKKDGIVFKAENIFKVYKSGEMAMELRTTMELLNLLKKEKELYK